MTTLQLSKRSSNALQEENKKANPNSQKIRNDSAFFRNHPPPGWKDWLLGWKNLQNVLESLLPALEEHLKELEEGGKD